MGDKKIFYNLKAKYVRLKPKSKQFSNGEIEERKMLLKTLLDKKSRKLNQREKLDIVNQLARKENLTYTTLFIIIDLKERVKLNNMKINNLSRELNDLDEKRKELKDELDNTYHKVELDTDRMNKFIMRYS